jgi:hypothetical protein
MYFIFTDESGTNRDSVVALYGGLFVKDSIYFRTELMLQKLFSEYLGIENPLENEIHFVDIYNYIVLDRKPDKHHRREKFDYLIKPKLENLQIKRFSQFVDELLQFLKRMNIIILASLLEKGEKELNPFQTYQWFRAFLNGVDELLSQKEEYGIIIADSFQDQIPKKVIQKLRDGRINPFKNSLSPQEWKIILSYKELAFKRLLFSMADWRKINKIDEPSLPFLQPRLKFESKVYNLLENIFFVDSKYSMFSQLADTIIYLLRRIFNWKYHYRYRFQRQLIIKDKEKEFLTSIKFSLNLLANRGRIIIVEPLDNDWIERKKNLYKPHEIFGLFEFLNE